MISLTTSQNVSKPVQGNNSFISLPGSIITLFLHLFVLAKHHILKSVSLSAVLKGKQCGWLNHW